MPGTIVLCKYAMPIAIFMYCRRMLVIITKKKLKIGINRWREVRKRQIRVAERSHIVFQYEMNASMVESSQLKFSKSS